MLSCRQVAALMGDSAQGPMNEVVRVWIDGHLARCAACAAADALYRDVIALARGLPPLPIPPEAEARVLERLARARRARRW